MERRDKEKRMRMEVWRKKRIERGCGGKGKKGSREKKEDGDIEERRIEIGYEGKKIREVWRKWKEVKKKRREEKEDGDMEEKEE